MAAGGFKEFVAGETLDEDEINDFLMQGVLVFAGTAARGSAITAPVEGQFSFLKDSDSVEFYDGSAWVEFSGESPQFDFVVVGGGAGGGRGSNPSGDSRDGGGGGAGGFINSVSGELTGGSAVAVSPVRLNAGESFTVTVGAGGAGATSNGVSGSDGTDSNFGGVVGAGGGGGAGTINFRVQAKNGGSGGGASFATAGQTGRGILKQGFAGGAGGALALEAGGGGGAIEVGSAPPSAGVGGDGGDGIASSITGSSVARAGGGGGSSNTGGAGGTGGGGAGGSAGAGTSGTTNTGGGGGGARTGSNGGSGGSGIVILKYPDSITLTIGGGLTSSTSSAGGFKVTQFTAGTDTVTVG